MTFASAIREKLRQIAARIGPRKTIYLHIGTHKTGTTSFQKSLGRNLHSLREQGYFPLGTPIVRDGKKLKRKTYHAIELTNTILRPDAVAASRLGLGLVQSEAGKAARRRQLQDILRSREEPNLILSAESFCVMRTDEEKARLKRFLKGLGRKVQVFVVFRNDADWRASRVNQLRKNPEKWNYYKDLPDELRPDGEWYFDRQAIIDFWSDIGELTILDYDEIRAREGNIVPTLYRAMGVDPIGLTTDIEVNKRVALDGQLDGDDGAPAVLMGAVTDVSRGG